MDDNIRTLISNGNTRKAIKELLVLTNQLDNKDLHQEVIKQSIRYENYAQDKHMGISSNNEDGISIAKINKAILDIVDRIPTNNITIALPKTLSSATPNDASPSSKWWKWIVGLGVIISIFAGIAEFTGYPLKDLSSSKSPASNTVTVLVHGKKSKDELVLPGRGEVKLVYGNAIVSKTINNEGEATFKQIADVFFENENGVEIWFNDPEGSAYRAVVPDSLYQLTKGKYVALEVERLVVRNLFGIVKDSLTKKPIAGVEVRINGATCLSNGYGEYSLTLPVEKQEAELTARAYLEGYQLWEMEVDWKVTQKEILVLLKEQKMVNRTKEKQNALKVKPSLEQRIKVLKEKLVETEREYRAGKMDISRYINLSSTYKVELEDLQTKLKNRSQ